MTKQGLYFARSRFLKSDYSTEETGIPSSAAPPATGTLSVQLNLQHSDAVDPPGLIRDATSSTLNKSSLAVNPRTLSSPHHAIMLPGQSRYSAWPGHGLPSASEAMSPALTKRQRKRLLKKEKAIELREDATRRQTGRAREQKQKQKQTEKNIDADFQLDGKTLPGSGWATG